MQISVADAPGITPNFLDQGKSTMTGNAGLEDELFHKNPSKTMVLEMETSITELDPEASQFGFGSGTESCDGASTNFDPNFSTNSQSSFSIFPVNFEHENKQASQPGVDIVGALDHMATLLQTEKADFGHIAHELLKWTDYYRSNPNILQDDVDKNLNLLKSLLLKVSLKEYMANYALGLFADGTIESFSKPNLKDAFYYYKSATKVGHIDATYRLGQCYELGRGTSKCDSKAIFLYRKAAVRLHPGAMYRLGKALLYGELDSLQSIREGMNWIRMSCKYASMEYKDGFFHLACIYESGLGDIIFPDHQYMMDLLLQGADMGCVKSILKLAEFHEAGFGTLLAPDIWKSIYLYRCGANGGNVQCMYHLGRLLLTVLEPTHDFKMEGYYWMERAAAHNYLPAFGALVFAHDNGILDASLFPTEKLQEYKRMAEGKDLTDSPERVCKRGSPPKVPLVSIETLRKRLKRISRMSLVKDSPKAQPEISEERSPARDEISQVDLPQVIKETTDEKEIHKTSNPAVEREVITVPPRRSWNMARLFCLSHRD